MDENRKSSHSHLFRVRLWVEDLGSGRSEWRGKVHHVLSGQERYFRSWKELQEHMQAALGEAGEQDRQG
jgi:hypothetical protein